MHGLVQILGQISLFLSPFVNTACIRSLSARSLIEVSAGNFKEPSMMSLKNLMEDKQLNFNQPLLSVRRFSSTGNSSEAKEKPIIEPKIPPLPVYKSELKSGPVRNPGTVPFVWEKTPGKPKDEEGKTKTQGSVRPPIAPKLPPGRVRNRNQEVPVSANASSDEIARDTVEQKMSSETRNDEEEDEVYRDAMDRFSRSESFFMNCSISGLSGLDGSEVETSGVFSTDPQTREFMMDRFLPAAKAMASETPPHAIRKQTPALERPREIKMATDVHRQNRSVQKQFVQETYAEESEDEDEDYDASGYSSAQGCGFLPLFCLKGSFVMLNSVPGMRMQANPVCSVRRRRNSLTANSSQINGKSNIQQRLSNNQNEHSQTDHEKVTSSGANESEPHRRSRSTFQELVIDESGSASSVIEKTLYIDSVHKMKSPSSSSSSLDMKGLRNYSGDFIDDGSVRSAETNHQDIKRPKSLDYADACSLNSSGRSFCEVKMELNCSRFSQEHIQDAIKSTSPQVSDKKFDLESQFPLKPSNQGRDTIKVTGPEKTNNEKIDSDRKQPEKSIQEGNNLNIHEENSKKLVTKSRRLAESKEIDANGKNDSNNQISKKMSNEDCSKVCYYQKPFAPPPPKSPSESWLQRTLPTSSRNSSWPSLPMRLNAISTATSPSSRWESTVKCSKTSNQHLQFSEELLSSIPEV